MLLIFPFLPFIEINVCIFFRSGKPKCCQMLHLSAFVRFSHEPAEYFLDHCCLQSEQIAGILKVTILFYSMFHCKQIPVYHVQLQNRQLQCRSSYTVMLKREIIQRENNIAIFQNISMYSPSISLDLLFF